VLQWAESARGRLGELDVSDDALAQLTEERDRLAARAADLASLLSGQRQAAAVKLGEAITGELAALAMGSARVLIEVRPRPVTAGAATMLVDGEPVALGVSGADQVEMLLRSQPDAPALPLGRGASGGELSRIMLAIEVCLADTDPVPTMVFDEVDAGVGGRAATELGRRLAHLARDHQVIVVTHLAQVAAFAQQHLVVDKPAGPASGSGAAARTGGSSTPTGVRLVDGDDRLAELARMLAGTDSAAAREHARELLQASVLAPVVRPQAGKSGARAGRGTGQRAART
jgi:DNA repair protein RecN (Recombination protein N)